MQFQKLFYYHNKPIIISQVNNLIIMPTFKSTFYKFIVNFNFFKKSFLFLFILINLYNVSCLRKQFVNINNFKKSQNTIFYTWYLKISKLQTLLTYTYMYLPNLELYKPFLVTLNKLNLNNNLHKISLIINNFNYLFLKKKWYNFSFKHNLLLKTIQNWIEYYAYCFNFFSFELVLRFFLKLPILIIHIK